MANLATLLCWIFIAYLLWRDSKRRPSLSAATWLPTIVVCALGSRNPSEWLGQHAAVRGFSNDASGAVLDQVFFLAVTIGSCLIAAARSVKWNKIFAANTAIMALYCYFALSSLWSFYPSASLIRIVKDFASTIPVLAIIFSEKQPIQALRAIYVRTACVLLPLSVLLIKYSVLGKTYARDGTVSYIGVGVQKNSFGEILMLCMLFLFWDHLVECRESGKPLWKGLEWDRLVLLSIGFWLLLLSQSKTSLVCMLLGVTLVSRSGWLASRAVNTALFAVAMSLPCLLFLTQQFRSIIGPILEFLGRDATFTGRTDIWVHIGLTTVNPLLGAGYWNFWGGPGGRAIAIAMQTPVPNAHDGYLDLYLDGGLIGLILLFCVLIHSGNRIIRQFPLSLYHQLKFAFLAITVMGNLTESNFVRPSAFWFTTLLALSEFQFRTSPVAAVVASKPKARVWHSGMSVPDLDNVTS